MNETMVTKTNRQLLLAVATKQILCHARCSKCGDENLYHYPMCLKNRRLIKFWWEKELN